MPRKRPLPQAPRVVDKNLFSSEETSKQCCWEECDSEGIYPAPKTRDHYKERYWFCLEHIRLYNASWNYFEGMSESEVVSFHQEKLTGHRPTWHFSAQPVNPHLAVSKTLERWYKHLLFTKKKPAYDVTSPFTPEEQEALKTLSLSFPVTLNEVKQRYKKLVKEYHPDLNQQNRQAEEQFKKISEAYKKLLKSHYFTRASPL